ncbi:MAG TPA: hypothetical protein VK978_02100, partial [Candidatus Saccharimonadales bacterium]|nr:hypothetical protein [Candidatus Saccharimonadales bacterium]
QADAYLGLYIANTEEAMPYIQNERLERSPGQTGRTESAVADIFTRLKKECLECRVPEEKQKEFEHEIAEGWDTFAASSTAFLQAALAGYIRSTQSLQQPDPQWLRRHVADTASVSFEDLITKLEGLHSLPAVEPLHERAKWRLKTRSNLSLRDMHEKYTTNYLDEYEKRGQPDVRKTIGNVLAAAYTDRAKQAYGECVVATEGYERGLQHLHTVVSSEDGADVRIIRPKLPVELARDIVHDMSTELLYGKEPAISRMLDAHAAANPMSKNARAIRKQLALQKSRDRQATPPPARPVRPNFRPAPSKVDAAEVLTVTNLLRRSPVIKQALRTVMDEKDREARQRTASVLSQHPAATSGNADTNKYTGVSPKYRAPLMFPIERGGTEV